MPLDSIADLERRIRRLEMELDQYKHKFVAPDRTVKTEPPLAHIDHGSLAGLGDNDHPQYLLTTGKAADSDKLDGVDSTGFATATHNHTGTYLPIDGKAADSDKLDGVDITAFKGLNSLTDPDADRVLFWDDSAGALKWLTLGTGLTITDTSIKPSQPQFYPLTTPKTSTSWDGDSFSTTSKTLIDLSSVFGVPAGVKAVYVQMAIRDSASSTTDAWIVLGADNTAGKGINFGCGGLANDMWARPAAIVPCNTDGDIYYQINASGTSTFDVYLLIWGYWL